MYLKNIRLVLFLIPMLSFSVVRPETSWAQGLERPSQGSPVVCSTSLRCDFPIYRVSSQTNQPFLLFGKEITPKHPRYADYSKSIKKFATARECWTEVKGGGEAGHFFEFNWRKLRSVEDLEVCMFRLFWSFETVDEIKSWLSEAGFPTRVEQKIPLQIMLRRGDSATGFAVNTSMDELSAVTKANVDFFERFRGLFGKSISLTVQFGSRQEVDHVGVTIIRK